MLRANPNQDLYKYPVFSLVLPHTATTGSMRQHVDPTEVTQVVQLSMMARQCMPLPEDFLYLPAQCQEHEGDSRRQTVNLGELDMAVEGPYLISKTGS